MSTLTPTIIQTEIPPALLAQANSLVEAGWYRDIDELILQALRRFLEAHQTELMETYIRQDVAWGLHGME